MGEVSSNSMEPERRSSAKERMVMMGIMKDDTELFRQFMDNPDFKRWLGGVVFEVAYEAVG